MCGIAGFWQTERGDQHPRDILNRMGVALAHRGPDDSGIFFDDATGVGLAFRRLSVIDLSPEGHQPMSSASGRYTIIFNGEVYNFEELRQELGTQQWRGHSDTEVMLAAIERWGLNAALQRFIGMFAFALWDREERSLHLVRDRLGIKPLYYGHINGNFVFASELKAIQQFPGFEARINRDALALYMRFSYVPAPHCIYEDIYKLLPGHILTLEASRGDPVLTQFWSAVDVAKRGLAARVHGTDSEIIEQLHQTLLSAVRLRMIADVPLGAFLSGGIDSSTVVALMQAQSGRPVKTFSIGFHERGYNEAVYAKTIAEYLGTDHTELYVTPKEAWDVIPLLPAMYDEPFADHSQIPTHLVCKLARQHVTVSLSGDGGDELFGGYPRYIFLKSLWRLLKGVPGPLARGMAKLIRSASPSTINRVFGALPLPQILKSAPGHKLYKLADALVLQTPASIYLNSLSQWPDPSSVVIGATEPQTVTQTMDSFNWLPSTQETAMLTDMTNYLPDDILTKVDRASMAVGLEARVPLLDHRIVEFAWQLPLLYKIRGSKGKWILRQILYRYVPPELVDRPKMGFGVPIGPWLRGPLRQWSEDLLSSASLKRSGFFEVGPIRQKWEEHLSGVRHWQYQLWNALMFQAWIAAGASAPQPETGPITLAGSTPN